MTTNVMFGSTVRTVKDASGNVTGLSAGGGKAIIATSHEPPAGFSVPTVLAGIYAYRFGDKWHCNIGPDDLVDTSGITRTYYVDPVGGNNANSGLTWALRKKSIGNAMRAAETAGEPARILLYAANGPFWRQVGFGDDTNARTNTHTLLIEAINGRAVVGTFDSLTWTVDVTHTNTYTAARSLTMRVVNSTVLDKNGLPTEYTLVANAASVNASAGTWYTDGTSVWVRPHNDLAPNLDNCKVIVSAKNLDFDSNANIVLRGIDFIGGNTGCLAVSGGSTNIVIADDCTFAFSAGGSTVDNVPVLGCGLFAAFNSKSYYSMKDGFNFHIESTVLPNALLVGCSGNYNGITPSESNNGFTCHDGVIGVSIGCDWTANNGTGSGHVSTGTMVWSVGDVAGSSPGDVTTGGELTFGAFGAWAGGSKLWLDSCRDIGSEIGVKCGTDGAEVYLRNHRGSGTRVGDVSAY